MKKRTRKLIGMVVIMVYVLSYALIAAGSLSILFTMALEHRNIPLDNIVIKMIFYAVIGIIWIFPLMPLIRWMQRPDENGAP